MHFNSILVIIFTYDHKQGCVLFCTACFSEFSQLCYRWSMCHPPYAPDVLFMLCCASLFIEREYMYTLLCSFSGVLSL